MTASIEKNDNITVVELHKALVETPSLSREESAIASFLESFFKDEDGLHVDRYGDNVCVSFGAISESVGAQKVLLLNTHLDVVPPSHDHPYPPFTAVQENGLVYGRGSVDAKASVAAMALAVVELVRESFQPKNGMLVLALTVCEELGGTDNGLESILPELCPPTAAIVGEPTMMQPCIAQKGLLILKLISRGKTAHAARAHLGINAIETAASDICTLNKMLFYRRHPFLGETTLTVTMIEGGSARNVVPDTCTFFLDIRTTPAYTHDDIVELVRTEVDSDVIVHSSRLVPVDTDVSSDIVRACVNANPEAEPFGSPTLSDWIFLQGVPTVKMGPGDSRLSHRSDEHVAVDQLVLGVDVYKRAIKMYFEQD